MKVYTKKESQPFKYVIALVIFILAMTFTVAEVEGVGVPSGASSNKTQPVVQNNQVKPTAGSNQYFDSHDDIVPVPDNSVSNTSPPAAVPEPATGILILTGLGVAGLVRKYRNRR